MNASGVLQYGLLLNEILVLTAVSDKYHMFSAYRATVIILPENKKEDCIILQPWLSFNDYTFLIFIFLILLFAKVAQISHQFIQFQ